MIAYITQHYKLILITMGLLLALFLMVFLYCALVVASRADEQMEREYEQYIRDHSDHGKKEE